MVRENFLAIFSSLTLHSGILVLMALSWTIKEVPLQKDPPSYVKATLVEFKPKAKKATQTQAPNKIDLSKRQQQLEQEKKARQADQQRQAASKKKQAEEQQRQELIEQQRQQEVKARKAREEERRLETRRQYERALREEEAQLLEDSYATEAQSFKSVIAQKIEQNWSRPQSARNGMLCEISINLVPNGHVTVATITKSSGDAAFDRSALAAVRKAEPFSGLREMQPEAFERYFRTFTLLFNPLDRRL